MIAGAELNFLKMILIFTMLFGYFFENVSKAAVLSSEINIHAIVDSSDFDNHCSNHNSDCDSTETECHVCHSAHSVYIGATIVIVDFFKLEHVPLLKKSELYYFSYLSTLLRPPIS